MSEPMAAEDVDAALPDGWTREGDEIVRTYEFDDYLDGVEFLQEVAQVADEEYHHPTIELRWREVEVRWTTHDAGGITDADLAMATTCNDLR
jgi:4a-hydroxytetrahydrobiopterin dehydratase